MPSKDKGDVPLHRPLGVDWWILPILALAAAVYFVLWRQAPYVTNDWGGYARVAKDIAKHLLPTALHLRTPGYPVLLVLTGSTDTPSRVLFLVQLLLHVSAVFLVIDLLRKSGFPRWVRLGCLLLMLLPPFVEPAAYALTETLSAFFLTAAVWLIAQREWSPWSTLGSGFAAGLAALTRPGYQLLGFALALALIVIRSSRRAISLAIAFGVTVGSFALYNAVRFGYPSITRGAGWHLSTKTATYLDGWKDERTRGYLIEVRDSCYSATHYPYGYIWHVSTHRLTELTGLEGKALDNYMLSNNLKLIKSDPLAFIFEVGRSLVWVWMPDANLSNFGSKYLWAAWTLLHFAVVALFLLQLTVAFGVALARRRTGSDSLVGAGLVYLVATTTIAYTVLISCAADVGTPRYLRPVDLLIVLVTTIGIRHWLRLRNAARIEIPAAR